MAGAGLSCHAAQGCPTRAAVLWLDEVGMRSQHQAGTTYAVKGKTPVLPRTGKRFRVHMISAISNPVQLVFMVVDGPFNAVVIIRFLQKLLRSVKRKVFLIADRHPVHGERKVEQWLNPNEYFNQDLKTNGVGKARPTNKQELKTLAEWFANEKKKNPEKVKKYFHPNNVAYAR